MKKLMFIVAGMLLMATVTFAQDTTKVEPSPSPEQTESKNFSQDMTKIQASELPDAVKQTLAAPEYKGWETATAYRSKNNDMYVIELGAGAEAKSFRFGADGKPILE